MAQRHAGHQLREAVRGVLVEAHGEVVEVLLLGQVQAGDQERGVVTHRLLVADQLVRAGGQDLAAVMAQQGDAMAPVDGDEAGTHRLARGGPGPGRDLPEQELAPRLVGRVEAGAHGQHPLHLVGERLVERPALEELGPRADHDVPVPGVVGLVASLDDQVPELVQQVGVGVEEGEELLAHDDVVAQRAHELVQQHIDGTRPLVEVTAAPQASGQPGRCRLALDDGLGNRLVVDDGEGLGDQGRLGPGIGRAGGAPTAPTQDAEEVAQHQAILGGEPEGHDEGWHRRRTPPAWRCTAPCGASRPPAPARPAPPAPTTRTRRAPWACLR